MARLVLVGLPGTGKTTVARGLARRWHCKYVDTDSLVSSRVGLDVADLIRSQGIEYFRGVEAEELLGALAHPWIVATGGGAVETASVRDALEREFVIWLDASDDTLLARLETGDRPLLDDNPVERLQDLRQRRQHLYEKVSTHLVVSDDAVDSVMRHIEELVSVG